MVHLDWFDSLYVSPVFSDSANITYHSGVQIAVRPYDDALVHRHHPADPWQLGHCTRPTHTHIAGDSPWRCIVRLLLAHLHMLSWAPSDQEERGENLLGSDDAEKWGEVDESDDESHEDHPMAVTVNEVKSSTRPMMTNIA